MSFEELQKRNFIEKYQVSSEGINNIVEAAKADVKTAQGLLNIDTCWAFTIAYNSILAAGIALMYKKGFRPKGEAKHVSVILFLRKTLGNKYNNDLDRFDQMRRRRNKTIYGILRNITEYEARAAVKFAGQFLTTIIKLIEVIKPS